MLVLLFRKCDLILWKLLSYQQHFSWLFLLVLLSQQHQGSDGKPTKWHHSIQRRFMWKQMDRTVDGFVDRVVTGARVMKSMIGDFMPPKKSTSNVMDYLPTETTRIRYIIRNPHTKETKVIRVQPSKKVVKLMAMTPKPLKTDKPKPIHPSDPEIMSYKYKSMDIKEPEQIIDKFKYMYMIDPEKLRQLEKEQELVAEGRMPIKIETKPIHMAYRAGKTRHVDNNFQAVDIVSSRIQELNQNWKPIYKLGETPSGFTTSKPYMMSALHTSVVAELLPEPQKQIYDPLTSNDFSEEHRKKSHTYEVTEYTAEESAVQPYTHEYYDYQGPSFLVAPQTLDSINRSPITTENPITIKQAENYSNSKTYNSEYQSKLGFLPSRGTYRLIGEVSTTTVPPSTTTTTEEPNYPATFLKKLRNRPDTNYQLKEQRNSKSPEIFLEKSRIPSNATYTSQRTKQIPYHSIKSQLKSKSQKWPPDAEESYLNSEQTSTRVIFSTTEVPIFLESATQSILFKSNSRKNVRLKIPHYSSFTETKHRSVRHRGAVKYGDKLELEERL